MKRDDGAVNGRERITDRSEDRRVGRSGFECDSRRECPELIQRLLNLVEQLARTYARAQAENQRLRDENNHLKGTRQAAGEGEREARESQDHSSEKERQVKSRGISGQEGGDQGGPEQVLRVRQRRCQGMRSSRDIRMCGARHPAEDRQCAVSEEKYYSPLAEERPNRPVPRAMGVGSTGSKSAGVTAGLEWTWASKDPGISATGRVQILEGEVSNLLSRNRMSSMAKGGGP